MAESSSPSASISWFPSKLMKLLSVLSPIARPASEGAPFKDSVEVWKAAMSALAIVSMGCKCVDVRLNTGSVWFRRTGIFDDGSGTWIGTGLSKFKALPLK